MLKSCFIFSFPHFALANSRAATQKIRSKRETLRKEVVSLFLYEKMTLYSPQNCLKGNIAMRGIISLRSGIGTVDSYHFFLRILIPADAKQQMQPLVSFFFDHVPHLVRHFSGFFLGAEAVDQVFHIVDH